MAKFNIYAVAYGEDPVKHSPITSEKFTSWDECKPYISGITGARYKGFYTESEADAWLKAVKDTNANHVQNTDANSTDADFTNMCRELKLSENELVLFLKKSFIQTASYLKKNGCLK